MVERRTKSSGGIRPRAGKWIASVEGNPDPLTGKRRRLERTCKTEAEANRQLQKLFTLVRTKQDISVSERMSVGDWLTRWMKDKERDWRPKTRVKYRIELQVLLEHGGIADVRLDKLTKTHVKTMVERIRDKKSVAAARRCHDLLGRGLQAAVRVDLISENVAGPDGPAKLQPKYAKSDRLNVTETARFLDVHSEDPFISRWIAAFLTGLRQGEILGLQWDRVDFEHGELTITHQLQMVPSEHGCGEQDDFGSWPCGWSQPRSCTKRRFLIPDDDEGYEQLIGAFWLTPTKSDTSQRVIPIPTMLLEILREHREATADQPNPFNLVWHERTGRPVAAEVDWQRWTDMLTAAGLRHVKLHSARKTAASVLVSMGADMHMVMRILGHSSLSMTEIYADVDREAIRSSMAKMGSKILEARVVDEGRVLEAGDITRE
ncbi:tyrosine integrase [Gordonia phage Culver]|nr:tyrosine integrase [Gordonia phage Culver]